MSAKTRTWLAAMRELIVELQTRRRVCSNSYSSSRKSSTGMPSKKSNESVDFRLLPAQTVRY